MSKTKSIRIEKHIYNLVSELKAYYEKKDNFGFAVSKQKVIRLAVLELISSLKRQQNNKKGDTK